MEPDSSTDFEGSLGGGPSGQQAGQPGRSAGRLAEQEADQIGQHKQNKESHNSIRSVFLKSKATSFRLFCPCPSVNPCRLKQVAR